MELARQVARMRYDIRNFEIIQIEKFWTHYDGDIYEEEFQDAIKTWEDMLTMCENAWQELQQYTDSYLLLLDAEYEIR